ncbi:MAG: hypothetical protein J6A62_02335 [Oscillospiraceae bacterium]|nr:hypothetical protein [Oscillospiraceae bacterium]
MKVRTVLTADEGMVLTDGTNYGKVVYLAEGAAPDNYREITQEEYEGIMVQAESEVVT